MSNAETVESQTTNTELDNILAGVRADASATILKFKAEKNQYVIGDEVIPVGTNYYVHVLGWLKIWIKFADKAVVARKVYCVARGEESPEREELDDLDQIGTKNDPWSYTYTVPFESVDNGDLIIFTTNTQGGQIAVRELCEKFVNQTKKEGQHLPIIELATIDMKSKKHEDGKVKRPDFKIIGWDDDNASVIPENLAAAIPKNQKIAVKPHDDMDDEIPF